ncbi:RNA polymerase sigma factor [Sphingomonas sp. CLY1604]|uniref:RNA polymerase sigma factor n=1 Tax=Sphingomonas sp. CLY1604 TaxID=3457786 RepID=UPI003FD87719
MTSRRSDRSADALARRWQPALFAFFLRRLRDPAEAEDLTQEVLLRLLTQPEARGDSYVFRIAQNLLVDRHRRLAIRNRHAFTTAAEPQSDRDPLDAHAIVEGQQQLAIATAVLARLPERTRAIFILYRYEKMSQDEIAASFGISASAVKQQVAKAMAALSAALRDAQ